jgi:quinol-cytochrome oxidoreductase complex cytochrome b subunit
VETSLVDDEKYTVMSSPNLTRRLVVVTLGTLVVASILTVLFRAPLEAAANPAVTPNPAKAPWYFLWLQELVTTTTFTVGGFTVNGALIGGIILPGVLVLAAIIWPYLDRSPLSSIGVWWAKDRRRQNIVFLVIVAAILLLTIIGTFLRGPYWNWYWPWQSWPDMPRKF